MLKKEINILPPHKFSTESYKVAFNSVLKSSLLQSKNLKLRPGTAFGIR